MKHFLLIIIIAQGLFAYSQTVLNPGDLLLVGVNANNGACSGNTAEDLVYLVAFKDISNGTVLDFTDNGWERVNAGYFGTTEGTYRFTRTGGTIPAGTVFSFRFPNNTASVNTLNSGWNYTNISGNAILTLNLNSGGDQLFIMQGGNWTTTGTQFGSYDGRLLYGFNSDNVWAADGTTSQSNLPMELVCFNTTATTNNSDFLYYSGPTTPAVTQAEWYLRFSTNGNWTREISCTLFNTNFNLTSIAFLNTFNNQPIATQELCTGDPTLPLQFTANGSSVTYQWYINTANTYVGASAISGANSNTYSATSTNAGIFYYYCEITVAGSCPIRTEISQIIINPNPITSSIQQN